MSSTASKWRTPLLVLTAGCFIAMTSFGIRSVFGLFLEPMSEAQGWGRETFAMGLAIQNLLWGLGLPIAGALADRYGSPRVLIFGALIYGLGVWGMAESGNAMAFYIFGGLVTGIGLAFTAFSLVMAAMARAVSAERRSFALGLGTAAGSFGQVVFSPLSQMFIASYGWHSTLLILACSALAIIPLALLLPGGAANNIAEKKQALSEAVAEAMTHRGFVLLTTGFFVCGFHVAFIAVHFPAYVVDLGLSANVGAYAISIVGGFNILGAIIAGYTGQRFSKRSILSVIYFLRALLITILILSPTSELTIYLFSAGMGLLWLSTVPLTAGIVAQVFGMQHMGTLFGFVFLSHQIGSFLGVWLGGWIYDKTGSYDMMWWAGAALGLAAALIHLPIDERPVARLAQPA